MRAIDLLTRSFRGAAVLGIGETATADMGVDGLAILNEMLDSWSVSRLYVYQLKEESFPLVTGQAVYMIGPGGDFVTQRPTSIESMFVRAGIMDYTVQQINNDAYSAITVKNLGTGYPEFYYYNPKMPAGELNLWPSPIAGTTLFIQSPQQLQQFPDLTTDIALPPGYAEPMRHALIIRLAEEWKMPVSQTMAELATSSVARLQTMNSSVPVLRPEFSNGKSGRFNIIRGF
jgi:hypothetical protein